MLEGYFYNWIHTIISWTVSTIIYQSKNIAEI